MPSAFRIRGLVRVLFLALFFPAVFTCHGNAAGNILAMPEIPGWNGGEVAATELKSPSGDQGEWLERFYYRDTDRHRILVVIMRGPGTSWSGLPREPISADDGLIGSGATYRTTEVAGFPAALETHPLTGSCLTVTPAGDETYTFETRHEDVDLEEFADKFMEEVTGE
jgi:hypothetical protein